MLKGEVNLIYWLSVSIKSFSFLQMSAVSSDLSPSQKPGLISITKASEEEKPIFLAAQNHTYKIVKPKPFCPRILHANE